MGQGGGPMATRRTVLPGLRDFCRSLPGARTRCPRIQRLCGQYDRPFSDHGFHLGEKERWAKRSLWEDGTRVPIIMAAPGFKKKQRSERPAELLDDLPTLLELAGLPADPSQEGQSLSHS